MMTINDLLNSRGNGLHFNSMLLFTEPHRAYPGKIPTTRAASLKHLERLNDQTRAALDTFAGQLRTDPTFDQLSPEESYMLRQRLHCALDFLSRLADSLPTPEWLSTASLALDQEDQWLLVGVWNEFGLFWMQNLAWRLSKGGSE